MNPTVTEGLGPEDLEKARRDFRAMLRRKRLSRRWIEEHAEDLLAQAQAEYAAKLAEGKPAHSVVGWLVNGAWWRAQDLLEAQGRRAPTSSIEAAFHLADESEPDPERQAIDRDRARMLGRALEELPERERRLLALVYFEGDSIRAAGRKIGWQKSAADRHHGEALERLRSLLGDDRSLLSPAGLGLAAWVATEGGASPVLRRAARALLSPARRALAEAAELASVASHRMAGIWRRLSPLADPAGAATSSGSARALSACGVAVATALCGVAASGVVPATVPHDGPVKPATRPAGSAARRNGAGWSEAAAQAPGSAARAESPGTAMPKESTQKLRPAESAKGSPGAHKVADTPNRQPTPVAREFGVEAAGSPQAPTPAGGGGNVASRASRPSVSGSAQATGTAAPTPEPAAGERSPPKEGESSSGSGSGAEFGL